MCLLSNPARPDAASASTASAERAAARPSDPIAKRFRVLLPGALDLQAESLIIQDSLKHRFDVRRSPGAGHDPGPDKWRQVVWQADHESRNAEDPRVEGHRGVDRDDEPARAQQRSERSGRRKDADVVVASGDGLIGIGRLSWMSLDREVDAGHPPDGVRQRTEDVPRLSVFADEQNELATARAAGFAGRGDLL